MKKNEELDFLCSRARILVYDKRPFITKKRKWSFHCLNCEQKFSSDDEEMLHYYVWDDSEFGEPISTYDHYLLCSTDCVHQMIEKKGIDLKVWNEKINATQEYWDKYNAEQKQKEIRAKEDAFMQSFYASPKKRKRNYFE